MDGQHFDDLAKRLATGGVSRRRLLGGLAAALGGLGLSRSTAAFKCAQKDQPCSTTTDCCKNLACAADGTCQPVPGSSGNCQPGLLKCKGQCTDPTSDATNCGGCGNVCASGLICSGGACVVPCAPGQTVCNGTCVDLTSDFNNCGACGTVCGPAQGCCGGVCTNLLSTTNCGTCGNVCPTPANGVPDCPAFTCQVLCNDGFANCDGDPSNGCEVNTLTDVDNCGGCGVQCIAPVGGTSTCVSGSCVTTCPPGTQLCGTSCLNTSSDVNNCGGCGVRCPAPPPNASEVCNGGTCSFVCNPPFSPCGDSCVDFSSDNNNCGGCGVSCPTFFHCSLGTCVL